MAPNVWDYLYSMSASIDLLWIAEEVFMDCANAQLAPIGKNLFDWNWSLQVVLSNVTKLVCSQYSLYHHHSTVYAWAVHIDDSGSIISDNFHCAIEWFVNGRPEIYRRRPLLVIRHTIATICNTLDILFFFCLLYILGHEFHCPGIASPVLSRCLWARFSTRLFLPIYDAVFGLNR